MAQSQSKSPATGSFATGLLARFNASTKTAQEKSRQAALVQTEKRRQEEERKEQQKKERIRQEVDRIVERNVPIARIGKSIRRKGSAPSRLRERRERRERTASPVQKPRTKSGPPKALPGMEFVVRKTEKKTIKVPHSSDYSDMFGEKYLVGVDLDVTKHMAKQTAQAAKENAKIRKEEAERRRKLVKEGEEMTRKENELRAKGLLTEKQRRQIKCEASAKDWLAVDQPVPTGAKRKDLVTRPVASESAPKVRTEKEAEKVALKVSEREVNERKRQLRERIMAMSGGAKAGKKRAMEEEREEPTRTRQRTVYSDDDSPVRKRDSGRNDVRRNGYTRREDKRYSRDRGYNSEEWSDYGDGDNDSDEDLYGIEALEREEEKSRRIGEAEDKMELKKEKQRLREKDRRRRDFERRYG